VLTAYNLAKQPEKLWQFRAPTPGRGDVDNRIIFAPMVHDGAPRTSSPPWAARRTSWLRPRRLPRRAARLDAYTGKLPWKVGGSRARRRSRRTRRSSTARTPPAGVSVWGAVKGAVHRAFQHYVLCLDAATGDPLVDLRRVGRTEINLFGNSTRESLGSPVAVTDDAVFTHESRGHCRPWRRRRDASAGRTGTGGFPRDADAQRLRPEEPPRRSAGRP
jgi:hypothetical protein